MNRKPGWPQRQSGCCGDDKTLRLLAGIETGQPSKHLTFEGSGHEGSIHTNLLFTREVDVAYLTKYPLGTDTKPNHPAAFQNWNTHTHTQSCSNSTMKLDKILADVTHIQPPARSVSHINPLAQSGVGYARRRPTGDALHRAGQLD
jgi:hypothetical protein